LWQAGTPNGPGDRVHYPGYDGQVVGGVTASATGAAPPLFDYLIPSSNPAIKEGAVFQFVFLLDDGLGHVLPCASPRSSAGR